MLKEKIERNCNKSTILMFRKFKNKSDHFTQKYRVKILRKIYKLKETKLKERLQLDVYQRPKLIHPKDSDLLSE